MNFNIKTEQIIDKPAKEVFNAIADPKHMVNYFITSGSNILRSNTIVHWEWSDYNAKSDIKVLEVIENEFISFTWPATSKDTKVEITISPLSDSSAKIIVTESDFELTTEGVEAALRQKQGWTDMLLCLKAYLIFNVNLRKGIRL